MSKIQDFVTIGNLFRFKNIQKKKQVNIIFSGKLTESRKSFCKHRYLFPIDFMKIIYDQRDVPKKGIRYQTKSWETPESIFGSIFATDVMTTCIMYCTKYWETLPESIADWSIFRFWDAEHSFRLRKCSINVKHAPRNQFRFHHVYGKRHYTLVSSHRSGFHLQTFAKTRIRFLSNQFAERVRWEQFRCQISNKQIISCVNWVNDIVQSQTYSYRTLIWS